MHHCVFEICNICSNRLYAVITMCLFVSVSVYLNIFCDNFVRVECDFCIFVVGTAS